MCGTLRVPRLDYGTRSDRPTGAKASLALGASAARRRTPPPRSSTRAPGALEITFELRVVAVLE